MNTITFHEYNSFCQQSIEHYPLGMFSQDVITNYISLTQVSLSFVLYIMNHAVIGCDYHTVWAEQTISSCYTQCYHLDSNSSISVVVQLYHFRCISSAYSVQLCIYTIFGVYQVYIRCSCVYIPFLLYIKCIFGVAVYIYHFRLILKHPII